MPDHLDVYSELDAMEAQRKRRAGTQEEDLALLDAGFLQAISDWMAAEIQRINAAGYADKVLLTLEQPAPAGMEPFDWERGLTPFSGAPGKVRHYVLYVPRLTSGVEHRYVIVFDYAYRDMAGSLQLFGVIDDEAPEKLAEHYPRLLGAADDGTPIYVVELRRYLDDMLSTAAIDYRERAAELSMREDELIHGAPGIIS